MAKRKTTPKTLKPTKKPIPKKPTKTGKPTLLAREDESQFQVLDSYIEIDNEKYAALEETGNKSSKKKHVFVRIPDQLDIKLHHELSFPFKKKLLGTSRKVFYLISFIAMVALVSSYYIVYH